MNSLRAGRAITLASGHWIDLDDHDPDPAALPGTLYKISGAAGADRCAFVRTSEGLVVDHLAVHHAMATHPGVSDFLCVIVCGDTARVAFYLDGQFVSPPTLVEIGNMTPAQAAAVARRCGNAFALPIVEWDAGDPSLRREADGTPIVPGPFKLRKLRKGRRAFAGIGVAGTTLAAAAIVAALLCLGSWATW